MLFFISGSHIGRYSRPVPAPRNFWNSLLLQGNWNVCSVSKRAGSRDSKTLPGSNWSSWDQGPPSWIKIPLRLLWVPTLTKHFWIIDQQSWGYPSWINIDQPFFWGKSQIVNSEGPLSKHQDILTFPPSSHGRQLGSILRHANWARSYTGDFLMFFGGMTGGWYTGV